MGFTGSYYQCQKCEHIADYSDSHCPNCGSQDEIELNAREVKNAANELLIEGERLLKILELHDDLTP